MEKINVAELLRDCPKGMELDCTVFNNVTFQCVDNIGIWIGYIDSNNSNRVIHLTCYGSVKLKNIETECVIFPKGKTTWEGFVPPCQFKDGDIIFTRTSDYAWVSIFKQFGRDVCRTYIDLCIDDNDWFIDTRCLCRMEEIDTQRLATEEEKQKLFDTIKVNGYKWNPETKTLEKLIEPKFKVGDKITDKNKFIYRITAITDKGYKLHDLETTFITFEEADSHFVKVVDIFDINTLKPFDKVLARDVDRQIWSADFFSHNIKEPFGGYAFACIGHCWHQCIPFEGNEHLLGITDDCDEYFKTWK